MSFSSVLPTEPSISRALALIGGATQNSLVALAESASPNRTALGASALQLSTGLQNVGVGYVAGSTNTVGVQNTFLGAYAGQYSVGDLQTFVGAQAGRNNAGVGYNTFVGGLAGVASSVATGNVAVGALAAYGLTTGSYNAMLGMNSGLRLTTGGSNVLLGYAAGSFLTSQSQNVVLGESSFGTSASCSGSANVIIGHCAGIGVDTAGNHNNVWLGSGSGPLTPGGTISSSIALGSEAKPSANHQLALGSSTHYVGTSAGPASYFGSAGSSLGYIELNLNGSLVRLQVYAPS